MRLYPHPTRPGSTQGPALFRSFWMGGFEGADHVNTRGAALDMVAAHGHREQLEQDHRLAAEMGLLTVRESIGWRLGEPAPGTFDLTRAVEVARSAARHRLQVIWTLMHYGTPPDLSLSDDALVERFSKFAAEVARTIEPFCETPPIFNLINEIGFLAWATTATSLLFQPERAVIEQESTLVSGYAVKKRLVRATLAATAAVRAISPNARFVQIEPLIHVAAPVDRPELEPLAREVSAYQWQVWDLLAGREEPGLGGNPAALDIIGVNHYLASQWEVATEARLDWHGDPRRRQFRHLLADTWRRYRRPLFVAETSHVGEGRAAWLHELAAEVRHARRSGTPVEGICLYPVIDRPDWVDPEHWHRSGLWDVAKTSPDALPSGESTPNFRRVLNADYADALRAWQDALPHCLDQGPPMPCLIVFSHLRWGFVYQRPQHLLSRLARHYRVLFIEEPVQSDGKPFLECRSMGPNLELLVPHTPRAAAGFQDDQAQFLMPLISDFLAQQRIDDCVAWFYTPMALPLLAALPPASAIVYDCMDELSAFEHAPPQLAQRETALLDVADVVLTGGPALYAAKRGRHANVHCLPSAVDAKHFAPAGLARDSAAAADAQRCQAGIARPRLGFFGVVDERLDSGLVAALADARPEWQFVMVGPIVKIDPASLPSRKNIHWLGMQSYASLPHFMAAWDVCLMPFALNRATRFISPTKTLEYMAGGKPIVSTPVTDVVGLYGAHVRIAATPEEFVHACELALHENDTDRARRLREAQVTVQNSSWDRSAEQVHGLIEQALPRQATPRAATQAS